MSRARFGTLTVGNFNVIDFVGLVAVMPLRTVTLVRAQARPALGTGSCSAALVLNQKMNESCGSDRGLNGET